MNVARFAAERCECWTQSFVRARTKREVGMSKERTALSGSKHKASGSAGGTYWQWAKGPKWQDHSATG
jgi:hypothetical protein